MASRNGLNPKIRGQKGIGFNRALPAPFGFGNGIAPVDNATIEIPRFQDGTYIHQLPCTFEWWTKCNVGFDTGIYWSWLEIKKTISPNIIAALDVNGGGLAVHSTENSFRSASTVNFNGTRQHIVYSIDESGASVYYNGIFYGTFLFQVTPFIPTKFSINFNTYGNKSPMDEFRFYRLNLNYDQIKLNYNSGIGNNPCVTEFLKAWYQFESFENLDFSALQDGTDIRLGIRDMSNQNNHALPIGMDTTTTSATYSIKPF